MGAERWTLGLGQWPHSSSRGFAAAGSLDNSSPVTSKPEAFFSKLQKFREANQEECVCSDPE